MKNRRLLYGFTLAAALSPAVALALTGEEKQHILDVLTTPGYPLPMRSILMKEYQRQTLNFQFYGEDAFGKVEGVEAKQLLRDFTRKYREAESEKTFLSNLQATAHAGAAAVPYVGDLLKHKLNRFVFDKMMADFDGANTALVNDAIAKIAGSHQLGYEDIRTWTPTRLIEGAREMGLEFTSLLDTLSPADRQAFEGRIGRGLAAVYDEAIFAQILAQGELSSETAAAQVEVIGGFFDVTNAFIAQNGAQLEKLVGAQEQLALGLDDLQKDLSAHGDRLDSNLEEIEVIQRMLYGKLSPEEQLRLLQERRPFLSGQDTARLEKQLEFTTRVQAFQAEVNAYASGANDLISIAQAVGFKGPELAKASETIAKAQSVITEGANIALGLSTGNYLGVLSSCGRLAGVFGGGGKSAAQQQHEQVMEMLGQIYETQVLTLQKLDQMDQKLDQIGQAQVEIHNRIVELDARVQQNHREVMEKLDRIHQTTWEAVHLVVEDLSSDLRECETFWSLSELDFRNPGAHAGYAEIVNAIAVSGASGRTFAHCYDGILAHVIRDREISPIFRYSNPEGSPDLLAALREQVYRPLYSVVFEDPEVSDAMVAALFTPSTKGVEVSEKAALDFRGWAQQTFPGTSGPADNFRGLMTPENLLAPEAVVRRLSSVVDFALLVDLVDARGNLKPLPQLMADARQSPSFGRQLLERSLEIVNVAIAQQNLLAGDLALERVRQLVDRQGERSPEEVARLNALLGKTDTLFYKNFLLYYFNFHARSHTGYYLLQNAGYEQQVRAALPGITNAFERDGDSWKVRVTPEVALPLVDPYLETFGSLASTPQMGALLELRSRLIQRLFEFDTLVPARRNLRSDDGVIFLFTYLSGEELPIISP